MTAFSLSDVSALIVTATRLAKRLEQLAVDEPELAVAAAKSFSRAIKSANQKLAAVEIPAPLSRPLRLVSKRINDRLPPNTERMARHG